MRSMRADPTKTVSELGPANARRAADPWLEQAPLVEEALAANRLKLVFVIGMPRSGTTWLQSLLACHAGVGALGETHLFDGYLSGIAPARTKRATKPWTGLTPLLTAEEERRLWRTAVLRALLRGAPDWASRSVLVEKTPAHVYHAALILELLPEAYFLHLVRDPRAVAASWKAVARTWGADWADVGSIDVATKWANTLGRGRRLAVDTDRYMLVRYETLHADGAATLRTLFAWLGLAVRLATAEAYLARCTLERMSGAGVPDDFFRKGLVSGWRDELSRREIARIERVAGPLMEEAGYPRAVPGRRPLPSLWLHRASGSLERASERLVRRMRL